MRMRRSIAISVVEATVFALCSHDCSPIKTPFCDADAAFKESSSAPTFHSRVGSGNMTAVECHF